MADCVDLCTAPASKISEALVDCGVLIPGSTTFPLPPGTRLRLSAINSRGTRGIKGCDDIMTDRAVFVGIESVAGPSGCKGVPMTLFDDVVKRIVGRIESETVLTRPISASLTPRVEVKVPRTGAGIVIREEMVRENTDPPGTRGALGCSGPIGVTGAFGFVSTALIPMTEVEASLCVGSAISGKTTLALSVDARFEDCPALDIVEESHRPYCGLHPRPQWSSSLPLEEM
jgi:hypothetical protein